MCQGEGPILILRAVGSHSRIMTVPVRVSLYRERPCPVTGRGSRRRPGPSGRDGGARHAQQVVGGREGGAPRGSLGRTWAASRGIMGFAEQGVEGCHILCPPLPHRQGVLTSRAPPPTPRHPGVWPQGKGPCPQPQVPPCRSGLSSAQRRTQGPLNLWCTRRGV